MPNFIYYDKKAIESKKIMRGNYVCHTFSGRIDDTSRRARSIATEKKFNLTYFICFRITNRDVSCKKNKSAIYRVE